MKKKFKAKILIVDDEKNIQEMFTRHFIFLDYYTDTANNGKEALEKLEHEKFDIMITDILMPHINGIELLKIVQTEYPMLKSIVISGYINLDNSLKCMKYHAETFILKPFKDFKEIDIAVNCALKSLCNWQNKFKYLHSLKLNKEN